jgi:GNAT superfamily N-acetyltransferase
MHSEEVKLKRWFTIPQNLRNFIFDSEVNYNYDLRTDFNKWVYGFYLNKKLIGYAYVECDYPGHLYIYEFEIKEKYRGNGYGSYFIKEIKKQYYRIDLTSRKSSLKFWRKNKFRVWDRPSELYAMANY